MNLLAIDTSTDFASVALSVGNTLYVEEQGNIRQHAQFLLPMIEGLLARADLQLNQLDGIVFGAGPGSFTGLRIACAVAKGLSFAHDLPLYAVSSLDAIATEAYARAENKEVEVLAILDARMQQVYWAHFKHPSSETQAYVTNPCDILLSGLTPLLVAGVGFEGYINQLPESVQTRLIKQEVIFPHARAMVRLVQAGKGYKTNAYEATPLYVRNDVAKVSMKE